VVLYIVLILQAMFAVSAQLFPAAGFWFEHRRPILIPAGDEGNNKGKYKDSVSDAEWCGFYAPI